MTAFSAPREDPQIVIGCSGAGHVLRGYESFASNLFRGIRGSFPVVLCKGAGARSDGERVLPAIRRGWTRQWLGDSLAEILEQVTFALPLLAYLVTSECRLIHVQEPWISKILYEARTPLQLEYKILFTNNGGATPQFMRDFDYVHLPSYESYEAAREYGIPSNKMQFIPNAIDFSPFANSNGQDALRRKYGVPTDSFIVLGVGSLSSTQKRYDHLLREIARLQIPNRFLLIAGNSSSETIALRRLATDLLGDRWRFITVDSRDMPEVYAMSDLFVHPALSEGGTPPFALLEAMASRRPVLVHDNKGFRWAVEDEDWVVDMSVSGSLANRICAMHAEWPHVTEKAEELHQSARDRFDWPRVRGRFIAMYEKILSGG